MPGKFFFGSVLGLSPAAVQAHSFAAVYTPPVPFWMYIWGACAALLASFLVFGLFLRQRPQTQPPSEPPALRDWPAAPNWLLQGGRLLGVGLLLLCIATGWWGDPSPYGNFNMTFFWIVFALGGLYLAALIGDFFATLNPWKTLASLLGRFWPRYARGYLPYPAALAHWPALLLYAGLIWLELFARNTPGSLANWLAAYTLFNLLGAGLFGIRAWFTHVELFAVLFRVIGGLGMLRRRNERLQWLPPFSQALHQPARDTGMLMLILFMLSATAFDGLRETLMWHRWFWVDLYHAGLKQHVGINPLAAFPKMRQLSILWDSFWLLSLPLLYLGIYLLFIQLTRRAGASALSLRELALRFAMPLLPIALAYNVSHYYTMLQAQGVKIIRLASDPFGWGWDLFGTASWLQRKIVPDDNTVWHAQVALIVLGHIAGVYMAHREALLCFSDHRRAVLSQIPMLLLMLLLTGAGLWVLSLPLA